MKKIRVLTLIIAAAGVLSSLGCMNREPGPVCPVPTEVTSSQPNLGGFEGVDMLVVVDNSNSMAEEQAMLSTAFFPLINALVNPLPNAAVQTEAGKNLRIAIVSSDMGLQWNFNAYNRDKDGFPKDLLAKCDTAGWRGDNGMFVTDYKVAEVSIAQGVIKCDNSAAQCPTGWACNNIGAEGVGVCEGASDVVQCPPSPFLKSSQFIALNTGGATPANLYSNREIAMATACQANLGIGGCGFEQQLMAAVVGLNDPTQNAAFVRKNALLVILVVSDEEDCSMKDGPGLFRSDEVQKNDYKAVNIACGEHPETLFTALEIRDFYAEAKALASGESAARTGVLFAAIVGVPLGPSINDPGPCQGKGTELTKCLEHPDMKNTPFEEEVNKDGASTGTFRTMYKAACTRDSAGIQVTKALPGIRYVELAQAYGPLSYVFSICNEDWSPAMDDIARLIADNIKGSCYAKRLLVDPATNTAGCNAVVNVYNQEKCDPAFPWAAEEKVGTSEAPIMACTIPKIPVPLECPAPGTAAFDALQVQIKEGFGWFYCENNNENFQSACTDGIDNDGDGLTDCDDPDCGPCQGCDTVEGDAGKCSVSDCQYQITFTQKALEQAKGGSAEIQCLTEFSFEDPNCQENTYASCNDGEDNDGNGPYDCVSITLDQYNADNTVGVPRNADPHCCPIPSNQQSGTDCKITADDVKPICGKKLTAWPDACKEASKIFGCNLPAFGN